MKRNRRTGSRNSLYALGGPEILSLSQDDLSGLWKIYLSTPEHYLVSREFDRSVGMYGNAPDDIVRHGLMEFSDELHGAQLSMFKVVDMFIDRCFDESVFGPDTENAVWMCMDFPTYDEVEAVLNVHNSRLRWFSKDDPKAGQLAEGVERAVYRTPSGSAKDELVEGLVRGFSENGISSVFMNSDTIVEKFLMDKGFSDLPVFLGQFSDDGDFLSFAYVPR